ncbi:MAG TPA: XdhC family protein [Acidimicrobiales bacterium]|nr:XdhC family protein [Acidimicrobiales bacterium]
MEETSIHDTAGTVRRWLDSGHRVAFARVVSRTGFSGDTEMELLACNEHGEEAGGLLRGTVAEASAAALRKALDDPDAGASVLSARVKTEEAVGAGLSCGGSAQVLVQPAQTVPSVLWSALAEQHPVVLATGIQGRVADAGSLVVLPGATTEGTLGHEADDQAVAERARKLLDGGLASTQMLETEGGTVLIEAFIPEPHVIVAGDGALADAIVVQAQLLGWPARVVTNDEDLGAALAWGGEAAAPVVLSHDPQFGPSALYAALQSNCFYIGALGSRGTQANRSTRLKAMGVSEEQLRHIHGPVGLDLGGRSPAQVALAICAEVLAVRTRREGVQLRTTEGPIRSAKQPAAAAG